MTAPKKGLHQTERDSLQRLDFHLIPFTKNMPTLPGLKGHRGNSDSDNSPFPGLFELITRPWKRGSMKNAETSLRSGLIAIDSEMARQSTDALQSIQAAGDVADRMTASIQRTGRLLLLGMGASHAAGRIVEPLYRDLGFEAIATPLSEQLGQPLPIAGRVVVVTSQSGESAEVLRWGTYLAPSENVFGITLESESGLAKIMPCLVGSGGGEHAFAATRSLMITLALHAAVLSRLGTGIEAARAMLSEPPQADLGSALEAMQGVRTIVTSGRRLQGVAEAIALGLSELSRLPCFSLEGGQLRHGPMEMLGPEVGVVMFRSDALTSSLVAGLAEATAKAGSPTVVFDASGGDAAKGAVTVRFPQTSGLAALFALLPAAQRFMVDFAASRVDDVGTPVRSQKITRIE